MLFYKMDRLGILQYYQGRSQTVRHDGHTTEITELHVELSANSLINVFSLMSAL